MPMCGLAFTGRVTTLTLQFDAGSHVEFNSCFHPTLFLASLIPIPAGLLTCTKGFSVALRALMSLGDIAY